MYNENCREAQHKSKINETVAENRKHIENITLLTTKLSESDERIKQLQKKLDETALEKQKVLTSRKSFKNMRDKLKDTESYQELLQKSKDIRK